MSIRLRDWSLCAAVAGLISLAAPAPSSAEMLPDQLRTDFPGQPPGRGARGGTDTGEGPTGFEPGRANDPFSGIMPGGDLPGEGTDLTGVGGTDTEFVRVTPGSSTRSGGGPTRPGGLSPTLDITGNASSRWSVGSTSGNAQAYEQQFSDVSQWDRRASLMINGRLWSGLPVYVRGSARVRPYAPTDLEWTLIWHEAGFDITYGDMRGNIARNSFATLQRQMKGLSIIGDLGSRGGFQFFASETRGITRRETIPGEGTSGPYYVRNTPIREETVKIRIDGQDVSHSRYRLDPDQGVLFFLDMIVPQSSVIEVVYEENRPGSQRGLFTGVVADYQLGKIPVSVTYISQDIAGGSAQSGTSIQRTEEFFANNSTGPFTLSYRPIDTSRPIVAYVDGARRDLDVHFTFNAQSGSIQFFDIVPATSTVRVEYYSFETEARADSKKTLLGFDTGYRWGKFTLGTSAAVSRGGLLSDGSPAPGGTAWDLRMGYAGLGGKLTAQAKYQHQDSGFSRVEATSFESDRSGLDTVIRYRPSQSLTTYFRYSDGQSRTGLALGAGDTGQTTEAAALAYHTRQTNAGADWKYRDGGSLSLTLSDSSSGSAKSSTSRRMMSASLTETMGAVGLSASATVADRTGSKTTTSTGDQNTSQTDGTTDGQGQSHTRSESYRAGLTYRWTGRNRVTVGWGESRTRDMVGTTLNSRVSSITGNLNYSITDDILLGVQRSYNRSSGATYMQQAATGDGSFGGGGGTGGGTVTSQGAYPWPSIRQTDTGQGTPDTTTVVNALSFNESTSANLSYRPRKSYYLGISARQDKYQSAGGIGYMADQTRSNLSVDAGWDPTPSLRLNTQLTWSDTNYLQRTRGRVSHSGWGVSVGWRPSNALNVSFGYDVSGSLSPSFRGGSGTGLTLMNPSAYDNAYAEVDWALSKSGRLIIEASQNRNRGPLDDSDRVLANVTYSHKLGNRFTAGIGARYVDFRDRQTPAEGELARSYRAFSYYAELRVGF